MTLADKLNKYDTSFVTGKEGTSLEVCPSDDSLFDEDGVAADEGLVEFLGQVDEFTVYIDDDPRDRRAGLVCFVEYAGESAWYDENGDCCWV